MWGGIKIVYKIAPVIVITIFFYKWVYLICIVLSSLSNIYFMCLCIDYWNYKKKKKYKAFYIEEIDNRSLLIIDYIIYRAKAIGFARFYLLLNRRGGLRVSDALIIAIFMLIQIPYTFVCLSRAFYKYKYMRTYKHMLLQICKDEYVKVKGLKVELTSKGLDLNMNKTALIIMLKNLGISDDKIVKIFQGVSEMVVSAKPSKSEKIEFVGKQIITAEGAKVGLHYGIDGGNVNEALDGVNIHTTSNIPKILGESQIQTLAPSELIDYKKNPDPFKTGMILSKNVKDVKTNMSISKYCEKDKVDLGFACYKNQCNMTGQPMWKEFKHVKVMDQMDLIKKMDCFLKDNGVEDTDAFIRVALGHDYDLFVEMGNNGVDELIKSIKNDSIIRDNDDIK